MRHEPEQMKFRSIPLLLFTFLVSASVASAETTDIDGGITLSNGMRVLVRERHARPLVAVELWVRAGAREETSDERGSAHFLEHTLFKGTTTRGPGEIDIAIENLGGSLDAATGPDYARFHTTVASDRLADVVSLIADIARNATLPVAEVEKERGIILDELAARDARPRNRMQEIMYANAFEFHPYRYSAGGSAPEIRDRSRNTLLAFYHKTYTPRNCTLVLVGDISREAARSAAQASFGDWRGTMRKPSILETTPIESEQFAWTAARMVTVQESGPDRSQGVAFPAPAASDLQNACNGLLTATLLGDRIQADKTGGAGSVQMETHYIPRQDPGLFTIVTVLPSPMSGRRTIEKEYSDQENRILTIVSSLRVMPPSASEFASTKRLLLADIAFEQETDEGLAHAVGYADIIGGETPEALRSRITAMRPTDITSFVRRFMDPTKSLFVRVAPSIQGTADGK